MALLVKNLPAMETWVGSPGWEDPLEKGMANHSSTLAWRIPWTEEQGRIQSMGSQRVRHNCMTFTFIMNNAVMIICIKDICTYFIFGGGINVEVELLGQILSPCLTFWGSTRLFSKVVAPF